MESHLILERDGVVSSALIRVAQAWTVLTVRVLVLATLRRKSVRAMLASAEMAANYSNVQARMEIATAEGSVLKIQMAACQFAPPARQAGWVQIATLSAVAKMGRTANRHQWTVENANAMCAFPAQVATRRATGKANAKKIKTRRSRACVQNQDWVGMAVFAMKSVAQVLAESPAPAKVRATWPHKRAVANLVGQELAATNQSAWMIATSVAIAARTLIHQFVSTVKRVGWVWIVQRHVQMVTKPQWTAAIVSVTRASVVHLATGNVLETVAAPRMARVVSATRAGGAKCATSKVAQVLKLMRARWLRTRALVMAFATQLNSNVSASQVGVEKIVPFLIVLVLLIVGARTSAIVTMVNLTHSRTSLFAPTAQRGGWVQHASLNATMGTKFQTLPMALMFLPTGRAHLDGLRSANAILASKVSLVIMSAPEG
jgi:hypothetical protein